MMPMVTPVTQSLEISLGETLLFGVIAVAMVALAIYGLLITRRPVYTIVSVIFTMVGLAFLYTALEAPFMGVVQVVVYTGAILMMFLFVLMLIGIDSADSDHETLKGQRLMAAVGGVGVVGILTGVILGTVDPASVGLKAANLETNPVGVAKLIFTNHVLTLELTGTLLVVAALGAMTLTHRDRVTAKVTQEDVANAKMRDFIANGTHPGHKPNSGVFAESNSAANPALTAYGQPVEESVNKVLRIRGQARTVGEISPATVERIASGVALSGPSTFGAIGQAHVPGMPGEAAPNHEAAALRAGIGAAPSTGKLEAGSDDVVDDGEALDPVEVIEAEELADEVGVVDSGDVPADEKKEED